MIEDVTDRFFPGFESGSVDVAGVSIHYVTGGDGPPLLLVHGAPQSHIMWRRVAPMLAQRFTLIIPDLRGYGRSGKPARGDYSKRRMAADLIAVMDKLGHQRFCIAGHDRGARVTRRLVKDHPDRIERVAILDIVPTAYVYDHLDRRSAINMWNWSLWAAREPIPETVLNPEGVVGLVFNAIAPEPAAQADYMATNANAESLHAMCEDYRAGASIDLEHDAADAGKPIAAPTLLIWGTQSVSTGTVFDMEEAWRGEALNMRFSSVESGHFMAEEKPEETAALLLGFFDDDGSHRTTGRLTGREGI